MANRERLDPHQDHDLDDLSDEEKVELAHARANVSKDDFDPREVDHHEKVVELPDRSSHVVGDLVDHPDPVIASDAQAVVDGNFPGGPNYPNGPADEGRRAEENKVAARQERKAEADKPSPTPSNQQ